MPTSARCTRGRVTVLVGTDAKGAAQAARAVARREGALAPR
jgi:hypothetical protein